MDDLATFLGDINFNNVRNIYVDGHGDSAGNIAIGPFSIIPPAAIRVALMASVAAHGQFGLHAAAIPVIFGTCFNHRTIQAILDWGKLLQQKPLRALPTMLKAIQ